MPKYNHAAPFFDALLERGYCQAVEAGTDVFAKGWSNGWHIWITGAEGSGLPGERDWCVCLYRPVQSIADGRNDIRSPDVRGSVFDALDMLEKRIPA